MEAKKTKIIHSRARYEPAAIMIERPKPMHITLYVLNFLDIWYLHYEIRRN
jgi:hypothetical protein